MELLPPPFLLWCGALAGPIFIVVFIIEGALRPGYNSKVQPVSALSQGPRGWIQQTNFIVVGAMIIAYALGLYNTITPLGGTFWGPLLVALDGIGLIGAGLFVTDLTNASSAKLVGSKRTLSGVVHDLFSLIVFVSITIACFLFAQFFAHVDESAWQLYSIVSGILFGGWFLMFARQFSRRREGFVKPGTLQRMTIVVGFLWLSAVALHLLFIL